MKIIIIPLSEDAMHRLDYNESVGEDLLDLSNN